MQYTSQLQSVVQSCRDLDKAGNFVVPNQPQEISSPESVTSPQKDVTRCIQPKFVYHSTSLDYYESMEPWVKTPMLMCLRRF